MFAILRKIVAFKKQNKIYHCDDSDAKSFWQNNNIKNNMDDTESYILQFMIKMCIIFNAIQLGWVVGIVDKQIVLSKESSKLTKLDKNTKLLINALICENINMLK